MRVIRDLKRPNPHDLLALLHLLPEGQRRVAAMLVSEDTALSYPEVAARLEIHLGSVHTHLRRIRKGHPELHSALMAVRQQQLARRHAEAVSRAELHSREWHRRQANRRYYYRFGHWPWERRRLSFGRFGQKRFAY